MLKSFQAPGCGRLMLFEALRFGGVGGANRWAADVAKRFGGLCDPLDVAFRVVLHSVVSL